MPDPSILPGKTGLGIRHCLLLFAAFTFPAVAVLADQVTQFYPDALSLLERPNLKTQEQMGAVTAAHDPTGARRSVFLASAGAKQGERVGKAALILPFDKVGPGGSVRVAAEFYVPAETPANSLHLMDLECKFCGQKGNPGLRLYLRHGRLRVDRKKINGGHAWANDTAPQVQPGRWNTIVWELQLAGRRSTGRSSVFLNGTGVLRNSGRTLPDVSDDQAGIDRLQIGITANSNPHPATIFLGSVSLAIQP